MSSHKHLLNTPATLVVDSLKGLCALNPSISLDETHRVVYLPPTPSSLQKVSLISGGGSGHEPSHAGLVGEGILNASICGNVFASPNVKQIRRGIQLVNGEKGTLIVVMNYSGDALHFGLASEQHRASGAPGDVRVLLVGDDVSVGREQGGIVGRRGLAGTILIYKLAAALAGQGASLDEVEAVAKWGCGNLGTYGIGLEHCHVPGTAAEPSHLADGEIEVGMGIHNEPGTHKTALPPLSTLISTLLTTLLDTTDPDRSFIPFVGDGADEVVLFVNCLGGVSELEMGAVGGEAVKFLRERGIKVKRMLSGTYMTSLNMPGFSLTLLLLPRASSPSPYSADQILSLLDAPGDAPGWKWYSKSEPGVVSEKVEEIAEPEVEEKDVLPSPNKADFVAAITRACNAAIEAEPEITRQDVIAGDGDAGLTLKAGAEGVLKAIAKGKITGENTIRDINAIAEVCEEDMGGTSGSLYSIFVSGLGKSLRDQVGEGKTEAGKEVWARAAEEALVTLYRYTRARPPSRTLVDPLEALIRTLAAPPHDLDAAAASALAAANKTKELVAKAGRGSYVNQDDLRKADVPDPGAWGIWRLVDGLRGYEAK